MGLLESSSPKSIMHFGKPATNHHEKKNILGYFVWAINDLAARDPTETYPGWFPSNNGPNQWYFQYVVTC